jgi:hypothetical protein
MSKTAKKKKNQNRIRDGVLFYKGRIVVSPNSPFKPLLLNEFHNTKLGGHSEQLAQVSFWESKCKDVQKHILACTVCQHNKYDARSPAVLLQPLLVPSQVLEEISLDILNVKYNLPWVVSRKFL